MAEPISTTGAIILGAAQLAGAGANAFAQGKQNKKTRKWNEKMYYRQLADNERLWHQQNAYNHPLAAMNRLKEAGLNPMLMQGGDQGIAGNAKAPADGSQVQSWNPTAPAIDTQSFMAPLNAALTSAQTRNVDAQTHNTTANTQLTELNALYRGLEAAKTDAERRHYEELIRTQQSQQSYLDSQIGVNVSIAALNEFQLKFNNDENERRTLMNTASIREINSKIATNASQQVLNNANTANAYANAKLANALTKLNEGNFLKVMAEIANINADTDNKKVLKHNIESSTIMQERQSEYIEFQKALTQANTALSRAQTDTERQRAEQMKHQIILNYADFIKSTILDVYDINSKDYEAPARAPIGFGNNR